MSGNSWDTIGGSTRGELLSLGLSTKRIALVSPFVSEEVNEDGGALDRALDRVAEDRRVEARFPLGGLSPVAGGGGGEAIRGVPSPGRTVPSLSAETYEDASDSCGVGGMEVSGGESDKTASRSCNTLPADCVSESEVTSLGAPSLSIPIDEGSAKADGGLSGDTSIILLSKEEDPVDPLALDLCRITSRRESKEDGSRGCLFRLMLAENGSVSCQRSS